MHHIYCISGLGADHRIFQKLKIENAEMHFINWEIPEASDIMHSYALRLLKQIKHEKIILLGLSYGGMLASEISELIFKDNNKTISIEKTILISSCKSPNEFSGIMKFVGRCNLHKILPYTLLKNKRLIKTVFSLQSREEEQYMKRVMWEESNMDFLKRSVNIILKWNSGPLHNNFIHIHGDKDRLLLPGNIKADYWIKGGGHFMIWNRADEISGIINRELQ